ncbi:MAG: PQQ-binding-like beta-propeller repeat protein, partial [Muriicola sp.]|nr:PQQ-binding-like beta-propeller repeat protein [Muriicola sp.]
MKSLRIYLAGVLFIIILLIGSIPTICQSIEVQWKFNTGDKVAASVIIDNSTLYIGGENGVFYALKVETGEEIWQFKTRGYILGKATVHKDIVFFESSNVFYALDKATGKEQWRYDLDWDIWGYK